MTLKKKAFVINKININNFQSHQDSELQLDVGVNVIVGSSDSGKSAILRALNWVVNNRPSGDSFTNYESDFCRVAMIVNGYLVERYKDKKNNCYVLDKEEFKAFNKDVPEPIKKIINLSKINFQYQMDSPFMISLTGGQITKELNSIANIDCIDETIKEINKKKTVTKTRLNNLQEQIITRQEELTVYQDLLPELSSILNLMKSKKEEVDKLSDKIDATSNTIMSISDIDSSLSRINKLADTKSNIKFIEEKLLELNEIEKNDKEISVINLQIKNIETIYEKIEKQNVVINNLNKKYARLMPDACPLCGSVIK